MQSVFYFSSRGLCKGNNEESRTADRGELDIKVVEIDFVMHLEGFL